MRLFVRSRTCKHVVGFLEFRCEEGGGGGGGGICRGPACFGTRRKEREQSLLFDVAIFGGTNNILCVGRRQYASRDALYRLWLTWYFSVVCGG